MIDRRIAGFALVVASIGGYACVNQRKADAPVVAKAVIPEYPAIASSARVSATIRVAVAIDSDGRVKRAHVTSIDATEGADNLFVREWYEKIASKWTFESSEQPSRSTTVQFAFRLMPGGTSPDELLPVFIRPATVEIREEVRAGVTLIEGARE